MYFASGEGLCLHFQIHLCINICSIERDVPEPSTDSVDVDTRAEKVGRGCVPNGVWAYTLLRYRRELCRNSSRVALHQRVNPESC